MPASLLTASRRFRILFGALVVLVALLSILTDRTLDALRVANRWSLQTYRVLTATDAMQVALVEMESGFRGYALTREPRFRDQWAEGTADFAVGMTRARVLVGREPDRARLLDEVAEAYSEWRLEQLASGVLDPATSVTAALAAATDPAGLERRIVLAERAREPLRRIEAAESALLGTRADRAARLERRTRQFLTTGSLLALVLVGVAVAMVIRRTRLLRDEIRRRERVRDELERTIRQSELILGSVAEGICGVDAAGYTLFLNRAAEGLLGVVSADVVGRPVEAVLGGAAEDGVAGLVRATLGGDGPISADELRLRRADGASFEAELTCSPILDDGISGAVVTFHDIGARRELERLKDEFVSIVSHELRTPLTSIRGSLGLLASGKLGALEPRAQRMADIAVQNTDRLVRLINDILDMERIEAGKSALQLARVDAGELVRQAVEVMAPLAERGGVRLTLNAAYAPVFADADRILQVLTNLLSNAIKFSPPESEVTTSVSADRDGVVLTVADRGRGIPEDRLERVFERFHQVDSSDARDLGGTGLGLAITRRIVEQHCGSITASSVPGEGSTFTIRLPIADASTRPAARPDGDGPLILVCDADAAAQHAVAAMLREWGYRTLGVADGADAVSQSVQHRPDAIVLDVMMDGRAGVETLQALRQRPETRDVPVVVFSALPRPSAPAATGPVAAWIEKATGDGPLVHALEAVIGAGRRPPRILVVEDDADLTRVLVESFSRHGIETLTAASGVEAVEIGRRLPPDLVVLDLGLPHGDGYWVVDALRESSAERLPPLVVYTASELDDGERARLRLGYTEFLTKGRVSPDEFERRVVSLLNGVTRAGRLDGGER
jgi:PAS domain S-box-containing protein